MVINEEKFNQNFEKINTFATAINGLKNAQRKFFKKNKDEIVESRDEYFGLTSNEEKRKFLENHRQLNFFFEMDLFVQEYEKMIYKIQSDKSCFEPNKKIVLEEDERKKLKFMFELDTNEIWDISDFSTRKCIYLEDGLKSVNSLVSRVNVADAFVMKVIYSDLKKISENVTNAEISEEYEIAKKFDSKKNRINQFDYLYVYKDLNNDYTLNKIDYDEYQIRMCMLKMLETKDIEGMYLSASPKNKNYILEAYYRLSSGDNNFLNAKIRTRGPIINLAVYYNKYAQKK